MIESIVKDTPAQNTSSVGCQTNGIDIKRLNSKCVINSLRSCAK